MKQPPMFLKLLSVWRAMPKVIAQGIEKGFAGREPKTGWVPLLGLSAISDALPPQAYADRGWAEAYNKAIMRFRRRAAFSAFWSGISKAELEAQLETHALLMTVILDQQSNNSSVPEDVAVYPSRIF